jgi:hypothetical protein
MPLGQKWTSAHVRVMSPLILRSLNWRGVMCGTHHPGRNYIERVHLLPIASFYWLKDLVLRRDSQARL